MRNPQELAFNDEGDLFTGDNNADVGDRSRLMYLPMGGDGGWTYYQQFARGCGPWTREYMWEKTLASGEAGEAAAQPAWILPPVDHVSTCPSGFAAYPGTGLPRAYDGTLWLVDYLSGVQSFRVTPDGAGFAMRDWHWAWRDGWGMSDFDFGPDGRAWALHWGESWGINDGARIDALTPPSAGVDTAAVAEVRTRLREGFTALDVPALRALLAHADRRLRQRASFELARRGDGGGARGRRRERRAPLAKPRALGARHRRARSRRGVGAAACDRALADGGASKVRRVAATVTGELGAASVAPQLVPLLADDSPRVRFAAAQALAALRARATAALVHALASNADRDAFARFAYVRALAAGTPAESLASLVSHASRSVRLGAALALREQESRRVAVFLADPDAQVATRAERARRTTCSCRPRCARARRDAADAARRTAHGAVAAPRAARRAAHRCRRAGGGRRRVRRRRRDERGVAPGGSRRARAVGRSGSARRRVGALAAAARAQAGGGTCRARRAPAARAGDRARRGSLACRRARAP
ncbi:MAG: HEAT repeat domain-containing protein [Candidatus Eisenbacteria bacterium]|nr:HEAT repeat domain-containing protein [Candidatus Eisenbacteria bacterium]